MKLFPPMCEKVPEGKIGVATIEHFTVSRQESMFSSIRGAMDYVAEGKYAKLCVKGVLMMSDTRMEHITNYGFVEKATGHVLIAGLGLGMILHAILDKDDVLSVTVVEKYDDVIRLVWPTVMHEKLTVIHADIYEWKPAKGTKYNTIYFDIWADQSTDTLDDMRKLHARFRSFKADGGWMESWRREYLKSEKRKQGRQRQARWYL